MPENFNLNEFSCPCCGGNNIQAEFVERLQRARTKARIPFKINSGWRCPAHNKETKGEAQSSHMSGWAADIACETSGVRFTILESLRRAGFTRLGIGKSFIHADCDPDKPPNVIWVY
jgi:uncharacterized protein YcbK (DUF882 family)